MIRYAILSLGVALVASQAAAAAATSTVRPVQGVKPAALTCRQFLKFDEQMRPDIVAWYDGFSRHAPRSDLVFNVEKSHRIVPGLVKECKRHPGRIFLERIKRRSLEK